MTSKFLFCFNLALIITSAWTPCEACLNYYIINEQGRELYYENYPPRTYLPDTHKYDLANLKKIEKYLKTQQPTGRYKYISDYAALLIKLGYVKEALPILQKLAADHPDEYAITGNLAVAYELSGDLDNAYHYLKITLRIDPDSHNKSEWIHLKVIEAALEARDKKLPIENLNVLNLDTAITLLTAEKIAIQLDERSPLTGSPNELYSKVLEESGDFYKRVVSVEWAMNLYAMAIGYSNTTPSKERLWNKMEEARDIIMSFEKKKPHAIELDHLIEQLKKKNWKKHFESKVAKWANFEPYSQKEIRILNFN